MTNRNSQAIEELLRALQRGQMREADTTLLERANANDLIAALRKRYPVVLQERRIRNKVELALARRRDPDFRSMPGFITCVFINAEQDRITGLSRVGSVKLLPLDTPTNAIAFTTGRGMKLDKMPDGWSIKRLQLRTVKLDEAFLKARGWHLDEIRNLVRRPAIARS